MQDTPRFQPLLDTAAPQFAHHAFGDHFSHVVGVDLIVVDGATAHGLICEACVGQETLQLLSEASQFHLLSIRLWLTTRASLNSSDL